MAKQLQFVCQACGELTSKWQGQCPHCGSWNTIEEKESIAQESLLNMASKNKVEGISKEIHSVESCVEKVPEQKRLSTAIGEMDRVLGGGLVGGSLILFSGEPGIGKSTLTLDAASRMATRAKVLYVSGEENEGQIALRAKRMKTGHANLYILQENVLENILQTCKKELPDVLIIDSVQVIYSSSLGNQAGTISQIRFVTEVIMEFAKTSGITVILIGHVTKDGAIAGPKVLEHLVDTVLLLEGERSGELRLLRSVKNRFGTTDEVGVFKMHEEGLLEVTNASAYFLSGKRHGAFGSAYGSIVEGTRAFLVEVQALTSYTKFGYPKRASVGFPLTRLPMILAVLERYGNVPLGSHDVYVNVVGGLSSKDTSLDASVAASIISSKAKKPLPRKTLFLGEVGLTGELRPVAHMEKRVKDAQNIGLEKVILPRKTTGKTISIAQEEIKTVEELVKYIIG